MTRPPWDSYWLMMAHLVATRATCPRLSVGCVLVDGSRRLISTGYNGAPSGEAHCPSSDPAGHPSCMMHGHCWRATHAEANAIRQARDARRPTEGATAYVTHCPCGRCTPLLIEAGIRRIVYASVYGAHIPTHRWCQNAGVVIEHQPLRLAA